MGWITYTPAAASGTWVFGNVILKTSLCLRGVSLEVTYLLLKYICIHIYIYIYISVVVYLKPWNAMDTSDILFCT